jgi:hypothetical protein
MNLGARGTVQAYLYRRDANDTENESGDRLIMHRIFYDVGVTDIMKRMETYIQMEGLNMAHAIYVRVFDREDIKRETIDLRDYR